MKVKCTRRQEFVVGGYSPSDKPGRPFASLLVGENGPGGLRYRGRVGSGYREADFTELMSATTTREASPFADVPAEIARGAVWVAPDRVVEIEFAEFTADGSVRHGTYLGLRGDVEAGDVTGEAPRDRPVADDPVPSDATTTVRGIRITHPTRRVFPKAGVTKGDLARYYDRAGDRLLAIAGRRPLSLLRLPEGLEG